MNENPKQSLHGNPTLKWYTPKSLFWVRDESLILLIDEQKNAVSQLEGNTAIVWEWLNTGLSFSKCSHMLAVMSNTTPTEAGIQLSGYIQTWREAGWLEENK